MVGRTAQPVAAAPAGDCMVPSCSAALAAAGSWKRRQHRWLQRSASGAPRQLQQLRQQAAARQHALVPVTGAIADVAHSLRHHNIEAAEHVQAAHELAAFLTRAHAAVQMHLFQAYGACGLHLALEGQLAAASGMLRGWAQRTAAATQGATQQPKPQLVWPGARPPLDLRIILSAHVHGAHLMNEGKP